eukprot:TRINITY_DN27246_c0_g1_i1.p1 TRINITY_DN27246_c0_g1~~TRINITY_DN27246_c0_g1_i1.p1  ORF type:complete len:196 (-),score=33.06 TRINITY_DN27246_c0_g1_i1:14-601(-)
MGEGAPSMLTDLWKFIDAVDWRNEPFFMYLAGFYGVLAIAFLWCLRTPDRTMGFTLVLVVLGLSTSYINTLGEQYGSEYLFLGKGVNYFEASGIFVSIVFGVPILCMLLLCTVRMLFGVCGLMVEKKVHQMKRGGSNTTTTMDAAVKDNNAEEKDSTKVIKSGAKEAEKAPMFEKEGPTTNTNKQGGGGSKKKQK